MSPLDNAPTIDAVQLNDRNSHPGVSRAEAEMAVRTLLKWAGDDPEREGLIDTPARVAKAYEEFFSGYDADPQQMLARTFEEVEGYN
ncbi:MAG: GTP cyclohydrolase I, partial [Rhodospirillaceae bacterium]